MKKNTSTACGAGLALLCFAFPAPAALVLEWDYSVSLAWGIAADQYSFSSGTGTQHVTADVISWGASCSGGATSPSCGLSSNNQRSGLQITDGTATGVVLTDGSIVDTNTITHFNRAISLNYSLLTSATLLATVSLTPNNAEPGWPSSLDFPASTYAISFTETPNVPGCGAWSSSLCDDIFLLTAGDLVSQFIYGDHLYTVQISATGLGTLDDEACATAGAAPGCTGVQTRENQLNSVLFGFAITAEPIRQLSVPEPTVLALLGIGLAGLGLWLRRG